VFFPFSKNLPEIKGVFFPFSKILPEFKDAFFSFIKKLYLYPIINQNVRLWCIDQLPAFGKLRWATMCGVGITALSIRIRYRTN
jgi:hypothetical protein